MIREECREWGRLTSWTGPSRSAFGSCSASRTIRGRAVGGGGPWLTAGVLGVPDPARALANVGARLHLCPHASFSLSARLARLGHDSSRRSYDAYMLGRDRKWQFRTTESRPEG
ncbi:unnamed protein product, partial [Nesidiocoris tenuis]